MTLLQGAGRPVALLKHRDVLARLGGEAAETVEELERRNAAHRVERGISLVGESRARCRLTGATDSRAARPSAPPRVAKHGSRGGLQQFTRGRAAGVSPQGEHAAAQLTRGGATER